MDSLTTRRESTLRGIFDTLLLRLLDETARAYGTNLTSLVVFGSVGRGTPTASSDIDLLLIAKTLPPGRISRVRQFDVVERALEPDLTRAKGQGVYTRLSPVFRTESEMSLGGLLFLDMVHDSRILYDRGSFFATYLRELKGKLVRMGSIRVKKGGAWHWVLKPDLKPGEVFEV